jgi:hypothetical protein
MRGPEYGGKSGEMQAVCRPVATYSLSLCHMHMPASVRLCVRACMHACVCVCVCVRACTLLPMMARAHDAYAVLYG